MYSKAEIFNLALGALLLTKEIVDADTDTGKESRVLRQFYRPALLATLQDLDLDSTSILASLELVTTDPNDLWVYAYKYPSDCAHFRRIVSSVETDNEETRLKYRVGVHDGKKVIFTNEPDAIGEYVSSDISLSILSASGGMALAFRLASFSAPLIVGKGASSLRKEIEEKYVVAKAQAKEHDQLENFQFIDEETSSSFVAARKS